MKIGVITFWFGKENYGMMLQCWAMQQMLKQMGHSPYVIRFKPRNGRKGLIGFVSNLYHSIVTYFHTSSKDREIIKKRDFTTFLSENIELSKKKYSTIKQLQIQPPAADCYLAGSDQIWAQPLSNTNNRAFFLDFGDDSVKRIAYAPSFAMKTYPEEYKFYLYSLLKRFNALSCREYDGVRICREGGFVADKVLDPTLLIDKDKYLSLLPNIRKQSQTIFIYSLNVNTTEDIRWKELKEYAKTQNLSFLVTPSNGYFKGLELFDNVQYSYATVQEWLNNIFTSKIVITPSFHGIVFSIIFERDFVFIPLKGVCSKGNNRILDLLKDLNLEDRILKEDESYNSILSKPINWISVKRKLYELRKESVSFLERSLYQ